MRYRITPVENSLNNTYNELYTTAESFEHAVAIYAKSKCKTHTLIWENKIDKPKIAYIGNSFCVIERETKINKYFALI